MAIRPVFIACPEKGAYSVPVEFKWHGGQTMEDKQINAENLRSAAETQIGQRVLEVSTRGRDDHGRALSAMNMSIVLINAGQPFTVNLEAFYQASKVFERGGPHRDLLMRSAFEAKIDPRLKESGTLKGFKAIGRFFPAEEVGDTYYNWLYAMSLMRSPRALIDVVAGWNAFTDIAFNPEKGLASQAKACAICNRLIAMDKLDETIKDYDVFALLLETAVIQN